VRSAFCRCGRDDLGKSAFSVRQRSSEGPARTDPLNPVTRPPGSFFQNKTAGFRRPEGCAPRRRSHAPSETSLSVPGRRRARGSLAACGGGQGQWARPRRRRSDMTRPLWWLREAVLGGVGWAPFDRPCRNLGWPWTGWNGRLDVLLTRGACSFDQLMAQRYDPGLFGQLDRQAGEDPLV
jgi:hypothetical protein